MRTMAFDRGPALVAITAAALFLGSCNAVFGLEDRSFGTGGGGGAGGDAGGSTTAATGGAGSTSSTSTGGTCARQDIARGGDFDPGWEASWVGYNLTLTTEDGDGQPVLRAVVGGADTEGSLSQVPTTAPACTDPCVSLGFSFYPNTDFTLYVYIETDVDGRRLGLYQLEAQANSGFAELDGVPCRLPDGFELDRLVFQSLAPGDYLLDDVVLEVHECAPEALACPDI